MHGFKLTEMLFSLINVRSKVTVYDLQTEKKVFLFYVANFCLELRLKKTSKSVLVTNLIHELLIWF